MEIKFRIFCYLNFSCGRYFGWVLITQAWFDTSKIGSSSNFYIELIATAVEKFREHHNLLMKLQSISAIDNNPSDGYKAVYRNILILNRTFRVFYMYVYIVTIIR